MAILNLMEDINMFWYKMRYKIIDEHNIVETSEQKSSYI